MWKVKSFWSTAVHVYIGFDFQSFAKIYSNLSEWCQTVLPQNQIPNPHFLFLLPSHIRSTPQPILFPVLRRARTNPSLYSTVCNATVHMKYWKIQTNSGGHFSRKTIWLFQRPYLPCVGPVRAGQGLKRTLAPRIQPCHMWIGIHHSTSKRFG